MSPHSDGLFRLASSLLRFAARQSGRAFGLARVNGPLGRQRSPALKGGS